MTPILAEISIWLAIALASVGVGILDMRDMHGESEGLVDGDLRVAIVAMHVRSATKRLSTAILLLIIGLGALVVNELRNVLDSDSFGVVFTVALFSVLIWNLVVQLIDRYERRRLIRETGNS